MEKIINKINAANSIAVLAHANEDPDALGSSFAMMKALRKIGKNAVCYISDDIDEKLKFLSDDYIIYNNDIEIPEYDLCLCLDCGDRQRLGDRDRIFKQIDNSISIDHHRNNDNFADENYVIEDAAATGEILYDLFEEMKIELDKDIAKCLYTAISADTGSFKYSNVTPKVMRIIAHLLEFDINHADIARLLYDTESLASMKLKGVVMGNIHQYYDGKLSLVAIDESMFDKYGVEKGSNDLVNIPRRVEGTEVAICVKKHKDKIKASLRSNGDIDVGAIAEKFSGGGHIMAAGCTLSGSMKDAQKQIIDAFKNVFK